MSSLVGLFLATGLGSCLKDGLTGSNPLVAPVRKMDLTIRVRGTGKLEAAHSLRVTAMLWWKPITWVIPEGAMVKKGDLIVTFEKKDIENEYRTAKADYAVAQAELKKSKMELEAKKHQLEAEIKSCEADLVIAKLELERIRSLPRPDDVRQKESALRRAKATFDVAREEYERMSRFKGQGILADAEVRRMISEMKEAEAAYICAQSDLRVTQAGAHPDNIREAELEVEQAQIALDQAKQGMPDTVKQLEAAVEKQKAQTEKAKNTLDQKKKDLKNTEMTAPVDGMVVYRTVNQKKIAKGVKMWKGCAIMDLPDLSKMIVKTKIREDHIDRVKKGQKVAVHIDALPAENFTGEVTEVGKIAKDKAEGEVLGWAQEKQESGIKVFDVTVAIDQSDKRLVPNLMAKMDILVETREGVLVVPLDAVTEKNGETFVTVKSGGRMEKRPVELGAECGDLVVVKSGLKEGERVCLSAEKRKAREADTELHREITKP
ncbi:MAG: efflux RND transporter periplasmic adaptor subunit [Planctomycetes bacterium]|nr:efflux RND transporter periplasmic adaptor subunit [Planctomycetota bacterium]